jgi:hypothetical protein
MILSLDGRPVMLLGGWEKSHQALSARSGAAQSNLKSEARYGQLVRQPYQSVGAGLYLQAVNPQDYDGAQC